MAKPRLKLVHNTQAVTRPFETDYAGWWRGHCKTRESAIVAAMKHMVKDSYTRCTITNKFTGEVVARLELSADRKRVTVTVVKAFPKIGK